MEDSAKKSGCVGCLSAIIGFIFLAVSIENPQLRIPITVVIAIIIILRLLIARIKRYRIEKTKQKLLLDEQKAREETRRTEELKQKLLEEQNIQFTKFLNQKIEEIKAANHCFGNFLNDGIGYFSNLNYPLWKEKYLLLYEQIKHIPYKSINLEKDREQIVSMFFYYIKNGSEAREKYNQAFLEGELKEYRNFFDNIEGRKLDEQQRKAIIIDDDNNLVIAGAGSGKTTTIVGKVSYLLKKYHVHPNEILLISFTRKAAEEMKHRIKEKMGINVDVMTFHKLGKEIIAAVEDQQPTIFDETQLNELLEHFFEELLDDPQYLCKIAEYFVEYLKPYRPKESFQNLGSYVEYLKENKLESFRRKLARKEEDYQTFKREVVKSAEEGIIANFLFLNNIVYKYEEPYQYSTASRFFRQYKPDFYLPDYDIYIEHFALIDKKGNVPKWFATKAENYTEAKQRYNDGIVWKRNLHQKHETILIETYSYQKKEGILLEQLKNQLQDYGVIFHPKSSYEIWKLIAEAEEDEVILFLELIQTFLALFKSNNYSLNDLLTKNNQIENDIQRQRNKIFLEIFYPLYEKYNAHLKQHKQIDFSDMINRATEYVQLKKYNQPYKYIIVDEFQDISFSRYHLLKAIKENNPGCKLFCVGDDWQSIYRFTGSDISLFTQFEKYFGYTRTSYIETTYRFGSDLIELSEKFILKNPNQLSKKLKSFQLGQRTPHEIIYYKSTKRDDSNEKSQRPEDETVALRKALTIIAKASDPTQNCSILILGRYNFDIRMIQDDTKHFKVNYHQKTGTYKITYRDNQNLNIEFLTAHKSKGLEGDYVIIINCLSGKFGFPCQVSDDPVLNLVLTLADQYENGEERRLFYVAMTRARKGLFFLVNLYSKSKFISEIEGNTFDDDDYEAEDNDSEETDSQEEEDRPIIRGHCPVCITGELIERSGTYGEFYGCTNFPFCSYTENK